MRTEKLAILMNPPYQEMNKGDNDRAASPVYHDFIESMIDALSPNYLVSINPSRWMIGGKGLSKFRDRMRKDKHIRSITHFPETREVFESVDIGGGVNYWLWDEAHNGPCDFIQNDISMERDLDRYNIVIQDNLAIPILEKVESECDKWVSSRTLSLNPFQVSTNFSKWSKFGNICYSAGLKSHFIDPGDFTDRHNILDKYKVILSKLINRPVKGKIGKYNKYTVIGPQELCTQTYLVINYFDTKEEADNFLNYMETKFFRFMLGIRATGINLSKEKFAFVPDLEDYTKVWTDRELYEKFGLSRQEISYLESVT